MELEADRKTRDYLYGQLLALADYLEDKVLWLTGENKKEDGRRKERSSNALRLMQRFAMSPYSTWLTIELALTPYRQRLKTSNGGLYIIIEKEFDRVMESFNEHREDFVSNAKLSGEFLLGFHCQRTKLWKKQETLDNGIDCNKTKE